MKSLLKKACFFTAVFCSLTTVSAFALSDGTYTADTKTYYLNPDTGKTDDGGTGNAEIGEGMCRSAVYEKALIEQKDGKTSITMRMLLYSNITNIRIATQDEPKGGYTSVKHSVVKESASTDSADLKFESPGAGGYVQVKMYVTPMGRDVCFYWNIDTSTAEEGSAGFAQAKASPKTQGEKLTDIGKHWAESAIKTVVDKGIFSGTTEITFSPDREMTRGMFVTVLGRLSGEKMSGYSASKFKDVDKGRYYASYIGWASAKGIVAGSGGSSFSPEAPVTCEQAASIIVNYAEYKGASLAVKSISPSTTGVSAWAKEDVIKAGKAGIITKQNTNGYNFTSPATRACVASMLANYIEYYGG